MARPADARRLTRFAEKSFRETFAASNTAEDMALYTAKTFTESNQTREILDPEKRVVLALEQGELIGYYMLSTCGAEPCVTGARPIHLCRLYVDSRWHGKKIAQRLLEDAFMRSLREGFLTFWMGVWEKNWRALAFYKKWGFVEVGDLNFVLGQDVQRDVIFTLDLKTYEPRLADSRL